jgi:hypothetical protein
MSFIIRPWHIFLLGLSGWINCQQKHAIEYLITENQILKDKLGKKRVLLNDDQRRRVCLGGSYSVTSTISPEAVEPSSV